MTDPIGGEPAASRVARPTKKQRTPKAQMRRNWWTLIVSVVLIAGSFIATIAAGYHPQLGLDLQGGISVRLGAVGKFDSGSLDTAVDIIRRRVDALGVAEPDVRREGNDIVVDLPGVKNRDQAERIVGRTAELRFRPVLAQLPLEAGTATDTTTSSTTTTASTAPGGGPGKSRAAQTPPASAVPTQAAPTPATTAAPLPPIPTEEATALIQSCDPQKVVPVAAQLPSTTEEADVADQCVVLPVRNPKGSPQYRLFMGKAALTGSDVKTANPNFVAGSGWTVDMSLSGDGADKFNKLAAESYPKQPPQNSVAIVLDGEVLSAPTFQTSNFAGGNVQISGSFTQTQATDLARLIKYGSLPVKLKQLTSVSVSPTLGKDQLRAGLIAGAIGLALVMLYVLVFYRILGLVVWFGLAMSGMLIWTIISVLGQTQGLALTLAGVCGLIVSVGVTVDSYVVYYERLKDEARAGRTIRASVDRGFSRAFSTIIAADLVSLIGAVVLYFLAEGGVRGFAFFLGLSVLLDLAVAYFIMHPLVSILGHKPAIVRAPVIGIAAGLDAPEVEA